MIPKESMVMEICRGQHVLQGIAKYSSSVLVPVELIFILIFLRYGRLLKDKSLIILLNISIINVLAFLLTLVEYKHEHLHCQISRITRHIIRSIEAVLITSLLLKSYTNLYYPSYNIKKQTLMYALYISYIFVGGSTLFELASECTPCQSKNASDIFYIFVSVSFITLAIIYNGAWLYEKGISQCFCTKEIDFILPNIYFVCALPLIINVILINISHKYEILYPFYDISVIIYNLKPIFFFIVLYKFNSDFNLCFKKMFCCCMQKKDIDRVVFNNSITIINVYSSSKI